MVDQIKGPRINDLKLKKDQSKKNDVKQNKKAGKSQNIDFENNNISFFS